MGMMILPKIMRRKNAATAIGAINFFLSGMMNSLKHMMIGRQQAVDNIIFSMVVSGLQESKSPNV